MANVNVINKNSTDYYFEDTAGRNIVATKQDDTLVAVKAYAVGDFFWYNNKLYKVKSVVSSGVTIVLATDADEVTVGDELKAKVKDNPAFSQASSRANIDTGESFATILGKIKKWFADLKALAFIDTATTDPTTKYLRGDGEWITFPQGGHTMTPTPSSSVNEASIVSAINTAITEGGINDDVVSAYGVGKWSNVDAVQILTAVSADDDGVGTWEDDDTWETSGVRTGWITHSALYGVLSDDDVEIEPVFKITSGASDAVSLYAMRIDDAVTGSTGGVAMKFNAPITASGYVGIRLKHLRTNTEIV